VFDHVTIRVADLEASKLFYALVSERIDFEGAPQAAGDFYEWNDFSISRAAAGHPLTRRLHVAFVAPSNDHVDEFWSTLTAAGYRDDGAPGRRPEYRDDYYGAFVLDPDGNSAEAVHFGNGREVGDVIDHLWIRVADLAASKRFYETIVPVLGLRIAGERAERFHVAGAGRSFALVAGDEPTENVHIAFPAPDDATVQEFHRVALAAGYRDNGAPGERPVYHPGYYGAYVLDPDGNNIEAVNHNRPSRP